MATTVPLVAQNTFVTRPELPRTADHEAEDSHVTPPIATIDQHDTLACHDRNSLDAFRRPGMRRKSEEMVSGETCPRLYHLLPY